MGTSGGEACDKDRLMDLPEPRKDGKCCRCQSKYAVTRDGRFCNGCLKAFLNEMDGEVRVPRSLSSPGTEHRGRSARSTQVLGGAADMLEGEDEDDDERFFRVVVP